MRLPLTIWCSLLALCTQAAAADYLSPGQLPDGIAILPPPPASGSARARADHETFLATRTLKGTVRWQIAADDVTNSPLQRYACALGLELTPASAPTLSQLLDRVGTGAVVDPVKRHYHSRRPFLDSDAAICEPRTPHLVSNGDYPSGHAANGWLEALVLAELAPEHATALLARGRAYGESRVVCGSHTLSAVEAGWMAGSVMFAALNASAAFHQDLDSARRELLAATRTARRPDPKRCQAQQAVLAQRPW